MAARRAARWMVAGAPSWQQVFVMGVLLDILVIAAG